MQACDVHHTRSSARKTRTEGNVCVALVVAVKSRTPATVLGTAAPEPAGCESSAFLMFSASEAVLSRLWLKRLISTSMVCGALGAILTCEVSTPNGNALPGLQTQVGFELGRAEPHVSNLHELIVQALLWDCASITVLSVRALAASLIYGHIANAPQMMSRIYA